MNAEAIANDLLIALRLLRRSPRFYAAVILIATLGIASATAVFSIGRAWLRPLPFHEPDRLMAVGGVCSARLYERWRASAPTLEQLSIARAQSFVVHVEGSPSRVLGATVSGSYFQTLGLTPRIGRFIGPQDAAGAAPKPVVLADGLWR